MPVWQVFSFDSISHVLDVMVQTCGPCQLPFLLPGRRQPTICRQVLRGEPSISCAAPLQGWWELSLLGGTAFVVSCKIWQSWQLVWRFVVAEEPQVVPAKRWIIETLDVTLALTSSRCCLRDNVLSSRTLWYLGASWNSRQLLLTDRCWTALRTSPYACLGLFSVALGEVHGARRCNMRSLYAANTNQPVTF